MDPRPNASRPPLLVAPPWMTQHGNEAIGRQTIGRRYGNGVCVDDRYASELLGRGRSADGRSNRSAASARRCSHIRSDSRLAQWPWILLGERSLARISIEWHRASRYYRFGGRSYHRPWGDPRRRAPGPDHAGRAADAY